MNVIERAKAVLDDADKGYIIEDDRVTTIRDLLAIVERLPQTADGVPVLRQDAIWWPNDLSRPFYPDEIVVGECFSTKAAAEAARSK